MRKYFYSLLCLFLFQGGSLFSQVGVSADSLNVISPGQVIIPVRIQNLTDAGAITLKINYNQDAVIFSGSQDIHPDLGGTLVTGQNGVISISWFNISPVNISSGILVKIIFNYDQGNSSLEFNTAECEIADSEGNVMQVDYSNGYIGHTTSVNTSPSGAGNPQGFLLRGNYPNPFNSSTVIAFNILSAGSYNINIYDTAGKQIAYKDLGINYPGKYSFTWQAENSSSGVYCYEIIHQNLRGTGMERQSGKMLLLK